MHWTGVGLDVEISTVTSNRSTGWSGSEFSRGHRVRSTDEKENLIMRSSEASPHYLIFYLQYYESYFFIVETHMHG